MPVTPVEQLMGWGFLATSRVSPPPPHIFPSTPPALTLTSPPFAKYQLQIWPLIVAHK